MVESDYYRFKLITGGWCIARRCGDKWRIYGRDFLTELLTTEGLNMRGMLGECISFPE